MLLGTRNVRLDIRLTATDEEKPLLLAMLTGSTPATDSALSQMIYQWLSAAQGVMGGLTKVEMRIGETTGSEDTSKRFDFFGPKE